MTTSIDRDAVGEVNTPDSLKDKFNDAVSETFKSDPSKSLGAIKHRWATKIKAVLDHGDSTDYSENTIATLPADPSSPLRLDNKKVPGAAEKFKEFMHNPATAVKSALVSSGGLDMQDSLIQKEVSHAHEVELIYAANKIETAGNGDGKQVAEEVVEKLKESRQDMYTRWAIDRHVRKIRKVMPKNVHHSTQDLIFAHRKGLRIGSTAWVEHEQQIVQDYADKYGYKYVGVNSEPYPLDEESFKAAMERFLVGSAALQEIWIRFRKIYRWEQPNATLLCLVVYLSLWASNLLIPAALIGIVWQVIKRKTRRPDIASLRHELVRIEDEDERSLNILEFIEKHGTENWTKQFMQTMGPSLLMKMADVASLTEVMVGFYEWRNPPRTIFALSVLGGTAFVTAIVPFWLVVKSITLFAGLLVFFLWPISSYYPDYRYLVSPLRLLFWDIPDNPSWALARLQTEAADSKRHHDARKLSVGDNNAMINPAFATGTEHSLSDDNPPDMVKYSAEVKRHQGRLVVNSTHVRFETSIRGKEYWNIPYERLDRVEKANNMPSMRSGQDLIFYDSSGEVHRADNLEDRNEAFAQIAGYSGLEWQVVG